MWNNIKFTYSGSSLQGITFVQKKIGINNFKKILTAAFE